MQLITTDEGVSVGEWNAQWVRVRRGVGGKPLRLLDPLRTGGNPISEYDVHLAKVFGHFPGPTEMGTGPLWGLPWPKLYDRRQVDQWLRESARPGRKPSLTYDDVLTIRRAKNYLEVPTALRWTVKKTAYHHIRSCRAYWWVEGINPQWVGFDWTLREDE
jgi:hypothetical protein